MRYATIVAGVDGSESGERAVDVAARLAKRYRARLLIVHAADLRVEGASLVLARANEIAAAAGIEPETSVVEGSPADVIVDAAENADADLVVVGSRGMGRARRLLMGSVSQRIAYHCPCDVLIVRAGAGQPEGGPYGSVLIATDGSATADRACRKGYAVANAIGAKATLVFVGHPSTGELVLRDTHEGIGIDVDATFRIVQGDPADKILDVAEQEGLDLVVVGNKGLGGATRFLLGSVPQKVMQYAPCDVLIARTATQVLAELARGEGGIVKLQGRKLAVYRDEEGRLHAMSPKCTHMGCTVQWNGAEKTWDCPCHGSRYAPTGQVVNGPAEAPLQPTDV